MFCDPPDAEAGAQRSAWIGKGAAGLAAYAPWLVFGIYGLALGLIPTLVAMVVAGPLTARAARCADLDTSAAIADASSESLA